MRGALIGCGYISRQQLAAWSQITAADIVAVCDIDENKARLRAAEFDVPAVYTSYEQMLDKQQLDFVDIATRPMNHLELVRICAERSLHVLCQKPMAETMAEAREMVAICHQANVLFMVNENLRHQAWFRKIKSLIDDGLLGALHYARLESRWRSTLPIPDFEGQSFFQEMPRLIVFEAGIHYLDTARFLFGEASDVYARLGRVSQHIKGEDSALVVVGFDELTCVLDMNWYGVPEPEQMGINWGPVRVEGTEGTALLRADGSLTLYTESSENKWTYPANTINQSFVATQRHFIQCLQSGGEPETSGEETLKTMALVFAAYQSAEERQAIRLNEKLAT